MITYLCSFSGYFAMLINKILLGITLAAPIGPVSIEMIKRGLNKGFLDAFIVRVGGALGNTLCLIGAYFGASLFMTSETKMGVCSLAGALVLFYLGLKALLDKRTHQYQHTTDAPDQTDYTLSSGLVTGFILSIANPLGLVFWFTLFAAPTDLSGEVGIWFGLAQNFAVIAGVLIWGLILSGFLEVGRRFVNPAFLKSITKIAGVMLLYFGLKYAYKGFVYLKII